MGKKVIIIGKHPISEDLVRQYKGKGYEVVEQQVLSKDNVVINDFDELCLLAGENEDHRALALLGSLAEEYDVEKHKDVRLRCHLLLQDENILHKLQTTDLCDEVRRKIDVYPFTMDEVWAHSIKFDYEPITIQSAKHAHVVIMGMGRMAEMVAIYAARIAHYPNYVRDHSLRTRITLIDTHAGQWSERFVKRYQPLFDNSYYRVVKPSEEKSIVKFHKPMYDGKREDFVDVEWEFVEADIWDTAVRNKLKLWTKDQQQVLTVVLANDEGEKNAAQALFLPNELRQGGIPIYVYRGGISSGYDVTLPLVRMAKNVNHIYDRCFIEKIENDYDGFHYAIEINTEERENSWEKLSNERRMSSIYNAMSIPSKMRSVGLEENDWDKFYDIAQRDMELLAQVEHNRWSVGALISGYRPCTDEEQEIIAADVETQKEVYKGLKIHYDLRAYNDLRSDGIGKSVKVYDLYLSSCLPLIVKGFADEEGGWV